MSAASPDRDALWQQLGDVWIPLAQYASHELNKESLEGAILAPLAPYPKAAFDLAWADIFSEDAYSACTAALIPGYAPTMPDGALGWIWEVLCDRRKGAKRSRFENSMCNSIAERVLISAIRWLGTPDRRDQAAAVLQDMIERTIAGTFWNDAHWAAAALVRARMPGAADLATRLAQSKLGKAEFAPFLSLMASGDLQALTTGDILADDSAARSFKLPATRAKELDRLLALCAAWEPFAAQTIKN